MIPEFKLGIDVKGDNPKNRGNVICTLIENEFAPLGLDIAIGNATHIRLLNLFTIPNTTLLRSI